jgi:hypothetical protein
MRKRALFAVISIIIISVFLTAAAPAFTKLSRLYVWNRTGENAFIKMNSAGDHQKAEDKRFYYLTAKPGRNTFTVERLVYEATIYACTGDQDRDINLRTNYHMTIPVCGSMPSPSRELQFTKIRFLYAVDNS